jgi:hypothetical protein
LIPSKTAFLVGRTSWAHFEFTRINIAPTILRKKIEDLRISRPIRQVVQFDGLYELPVARELRKLASTDRQVEVTGWKVTRRDGDAQLMGQVLQLQPYECLQRRCAMVTGRL